MADANYIIVYHACGVCPSGYIMDRGPLDDVHIGMLVAPALREGRRISYHSRKGPCYVKMKCDCGAVTGGEKP